jgi:hypothetical protein
MNEARMMLGACAMYNTTPYSLLLPTHAMAAQCPCTHYPSTSEYLLHLGYGAQNFYFILFFWSVGGN